MSLTIIAEAGVNHNGDLGLARALADAAADSGADYVKFQSFVPDALAAAIAGKATYQTRSGGAGESQRDMLARLALGRDAELALAAHCADRGIAILVTPFDLSSLAFVVDQLQVPAIKISSGSLTNGPLLHAAAGTGLPLIVSTGMASEAEVAEALDLLAWTALEKVAPPSRTAFAGRAASPEGQAVITAKVTLLHCTTAYPTPPADVNLRAMDTLAKRFKCPVGYSDHTHGLAVALAAVGRGAVMIEKHFTLDRKLPGPDHAASLEPDELAALVATARTAAEALGSSEKTPAPSEQSNARIVRQSLIALQSVAAGEIFSEANLGVKRPGTGASPMHYWDYLGRPAVRAYDADEVIDP